MIQFGPERGAVSFGFDGGAVCRGGGVEVDAKFDEVALEHVEGAVEDCFP